MAHLLVVDDEAPFGPQPRWPSSFGSAVIA